MSERQPGAFQLRPLETDDFAAMAGWFQNVTDLARFDRSARVPFSTAGMEDTWGQAADPKRKSSRCWFAITTGTEELCGVSGLESITAVNRDAVIALFIDENSRRQGIGIRATALVLDFAFRQIGLNRVTSYYREDNLCSQRMTARAGFETEGRMREAWFAEGRYFDMITVGLLRRDWEARRKALARELDASCTARFRGAVVSGWAWPPGPQDPPAD
ncbi:GNAT family N-acetyltransferase [Leisingera daeponensis]|uniref:GNAT family N-acetyltransferase n=1 Tax=Leisingera daeponensis TaxID=405746 RepID=UPI001C976850|nr:GNAT family protein [Leisingera daeponensis]MBY6058700.1 GNAT family N-acetyltransferase [Leisingera daeponensis]